MTVFSNVRIADLENELRQKIQRYEPQNGVCVAVAYGVEEPVKLILGNEPKKGISSVRVLSGGHGGQIQRFKLRAQHVLAQIRFSRKKLIQHGVVIDQIVISGDAGQSSGQSH